MEPIVLAYPSSMSYWRSYTGATPKPVRISLSTDDLRDPTAWALQTARSNGAALQTLHAPDGRLHFMSSPSQKRRRTKGIETHSLKGVLPVGSLCRIGKDCYVLSPTWCYVHVAKHLNVPSACMFANELCGTYLLATGHPTTGHSYGAASARGNQSGIAYGQREEIPYRPALTTVEALKAYTRSRYPSRGDSTAVRALRWAVDSCRSPAEAEGEVKLCLPYRYGGWHAHIPSMNGRVDLSENAQRLLKVPYCSCDLLWLEHSVAIEYYGRVHSRQSQMAHDWEREVILQDKGIEVIPMHALQLKDPTRFAAIAMHLKNKLGERYRADQVAHALAMKALFGEMQEYMGFRDCGWLL